MFRRSLGWWTLFAIVYVAVASAIYFSLGVIADHALGLTPVVYLLAGLFFVLAAMTYVEGASMHQDRGGSTVFARYAFNEVVSFLAGWAVLLDYIILLAVSAFTATNYLSAFWRPAGDGAPELILAIAIIVSVAAGTIRGWSPSRAARIAALVVADIAVQLLIIVIGLATFFNWRALVDPIDLGTYPQWDDFVFSLGIATVVYIGLESASGLAGEVRISRRGLKRLISSATAAVMVGYVGIAVVALTALPVVGNATSLARNFLEAPMLGIAESFPQDWLAAAAKYVLAGLGVLTLYAAAQSSMLGLSRLAYSLALNRQIPSGLGRLHPTRSTPYVLIVIAALLAIALVVPLDLDFLVGIFAFGALIGLTIAHLSLVVLRFREPQRPRPYKMPGNVRMRGAELPVPAVLGALFGALAWIGVILTHSGAKYVGFGWLAVGLVLYVAYRKGSGKTLTKRVVVPERALRREPRDRRRGAAEYGSILVPITGTPLDDDIVQTAGRLAAAEDEDTLETAGSTLEAIWIFELPMSLPIDAALPEEQLRHARAALARAKAVGEEYEGVHVATATVRARRRGAAIVDEARRRGVQAIVMAAEEPSRQRGGALLGGLGGPRENFVGEATKYVLAKAPCQVILTAPPSAEPARATGDGAPRTGAPTGSDAR
ncbi:MAG TPA: universal stress protein [Solirubrobacteraceae bacterium]|nr:universal stress protein [Solirubrobacteraceae bacterium]